MYFIGICVVHIKVFKIRFRWISVCVFICIDVSIVFVFVCACVNVNAYLYKFVFVFGWEWICMFFLLFVFIWICLCVLMFLNCRVYSLNEKFAIAFGTFFIWNTNESYMFDKVCVYTIFLYYIYWKFILVMMKIIIKSFEMK
jgi:hypothetical protein